MKYLAHVRQDSSGVVFEQTVEEHCRNCASYASEQITGLSNAAYLAGLIHDMGKYTVAFQDYITRAASGLPVRRGSVNHTFAAVRFAMERWHSPDKASLRNMVCEVIAVAAGAHHGLFDCIDPDGNDKLLHRLTAESIGYQEAEELFLSNCTGLAELDALFHSAENEILTAVEQCKAYVNKGEELRFLLSLLARLLMSCVIDADRRDTAEFMHDFSFPRPQITDWSHSLSKVEKKLDEFSADSPINIMRNEISERCREAAKRGNGIYQLSVPTGGGKTLSSLRYALAAAVEQKKARIFFVIPLLSVLEQNAAVIREYIDDDTLILEHHSNIVHDTVQYDELNESELLMDTWDSPIVITTLVQLLNTLFLGKTSSIRRMSALSNSIIVIDEVQSVPRKMLSLFNMAMNFLAPACNCSIVLCSATQPCLEAVKHSIHFQEPANLISIDPAWWETFRRTQIIDKRTSGGYTAEELAGFAVECVEEHNSLLLICNTKAQARSIYNSIKDLPNTSIYHLSTSMCMEHRVNTLASITKCLDKKQRVICVSTQLVEAGVDFSFACVIRVSAGLDNIIQAAGRCNRSGEFNRLCPVYIVNVKQESLTHLAEIRQSQLAMEHDLAIYQLDSNRFNHNLSTEEAIEAYYRRLYTDMPVNATDYPLKNLDSSIFTLLSDNRTSQYHSPSNGKYTIAQAFKTAGDVFSVFDNNTVDVIVPYAQGSDVIAELCSEECKGDFNYHYRKELLDKAKRFSVSLYDHEIKLLQDSGGLKGLFKNSVLVINPDFYSESTGFDISGNVNQFLEG